MFDFFFHFVIFIFMFIKANSSWLITKSIKVLEIKTSMLFNSDFANNTILSYFFIFFLIIDFYFLILEAISQIFNPVSEFVIPVGIPTKEPKPKMEIDPVFVEAKIKKCSKL